MPAYSTLRTFVRALQTGRTNIVDVLEALCAEATSPGPANDALQSIRAPRSADNLPPALLTAIGNRLKPKEIAHIQHWPAAQKERVRAEIVRAIDEGEPISFTWELYDGAVPDADFRSRQGGGRTIAFRSPRSAVRLSGLNYGDISVEEL
jgi:hypothetical protein